VQSFSYYKKLKNDKVCEIMLKYNKGELNCVLWLFDNFSQKSSNDIQLDDNLTS